MIAGKLRSGDISTIYQRRAANRAAEQHHLLERGKRDATPGVIRNVENVVRLKRNIGGLSLQDLLHLYGNFRLLRAVRLAVDISALVGVLRDSFGERDQL